MLVKQRYGCALSAYEERERTKFLDDFFSDCRGTDFFVSPPTQLRARTRQGLRAGIKAAVVERHPGYGSVYQLQGRDLEWVVEGNPSHGEVFVSVGVAAAIQTPEREALPEAVSEAVSYARELARHYIGFLQESVSSLHQQLAMPRGDA